MKAHQKRPAVSPVSAQRQHIPSDPFRQGMPSLVDGANRKDLPEAMRTKMENAFGADFSHLQIYESEKVAEGGARAVTQGNAIAFAPGEFNPYSPSSEALLGHELSHVVSQARGESRGNGLLTDSYLEAKADREGVMAAAGQQVYSGPLTPLSPSSPASVSGPMQCKRGSGKKLEDARSAAISQVNQNMDSARSPELMEIDPQNDDQIWQQRVNQRRGEVSYLDSTSLTSMENISRRLLGELGGARSKKEIDSKMALWNHYYGGRYNNVIVDENDGLRPQTNRERSKAEGEAIQKDRAAYLENRKRAEAELVQRQKEEEAARREREWKRLEEENELFGNDRRRHYWEMTDEIIDLPRQDPNGKKSRFGNMMRENIEENNENLRRAKAYEQEAQLLEGSGEEAPGDGEVSFSMLMDRLYREPAPRRKRKAVGKKNGRTRLGLRNYVDEDF